MFKKTLKGNAVEPIMEKKQNSRKQKEELQNKILQQLCIYHSIF